MKKQLVIIGIVTLLVCVGLSGCNGNNNGNIYTSTGDISNHPNSYINQTVMLKGQYFGEKALYFIDIGGPFPITIPSNVQKPIPFVNNGTYVFTGIVRYGTIPNSSTSGLYLEVTKIETI